MVVGSTLGYAQTCTAPVKTYANYEDHGDSHVLVASSSTSSTSSAVGANPTNTPAVLNVVTVLGAAEAWIELKFVGSTIPAGSTTYVKIGGSSALNVLNLIGGASSPVSAYSGATSATTIAGQGTQIAAASVKVSNFSAADGSIYLAITSALAYNAVKIAINASVIVGTGQLFIYHAYFQTAGYSCDPAAGSAPSVSGLLTLGGAVTNPNNAFDNDKSTATVFSMGVAGVGTTLKETIYFPGPSNTGDAATITFSIPPALLLDLSLLNNISVTPYNGNVAGTSVSLTSLLSLDLLALLRANNKTTVSIVPSSTFDRIEISMSSLLGVLAQMNLYEVQRTAPIPTFVSPAAQNPSICYNNSTTLSATAGTCNELHWYTVPTGGTATVAATYSTGNLTSTTTYYVAAARIGCTAESERVPVKVTVNPLPAITPGNTTVCKGITTASLPYSAATNTPTTYSITWNGAATAAGFLNVTDQALVTTPITLSVPSAAAAATYSGTLTVKNANGCTSTTNNFNVVVHPKPLTPHIAIQ